MSSFSVFVDCIVYVRMCVSVYLCASLPAMIKITPPVRATLSFCSGCSAMQVVHLMPTPSTMIAMKDSMMAANISPRVPWTRAKKHHEKRSFWCLEFAVHM